MFGLSIMNKLKFTLEITPSRKDILIITPENEIILKRTYELKQYFSQFIKGIDPSKELNFNKKQLENYTYEILDKSDKYIDRPPRDIDFYYIDLDIDDHFVSLFNKLADVNKYEWALTEWNIKKNKKESYKELGKTVKFYAILYFQKADDDKSHRFIQDTPFSDPQTFKYNWN